MKIACAVRLLGFAFIDGAVADRPPPNASSILDDTRQPLMHMEHGSADEIIEKLNTQITTVAGLIREQKVLEDRKNNVVREQRKIESWYGEACKQILGITESFPAHEQHMRGDFGSYLKTLQKKMCGDEHGAVLPINQMAELSLTDLESLKQNLQQPKANLDEDQLLMHLDRQIVVDNNVTKLVTNVVAKTKELKKLEESKTEIVTKQRQNEQKYGSARRDLLDTVNKILRLSDTLGIKHDDEVLLDKIKKSLEGKKKKLDAGDNHDAQVATRQATRRSANVTIGTKRNLASVSHVQSPSVHKKRA